MTSNSVTLSAKKIYDNLNFNDKLLTSINIYSLYNKIYTAGCSDEEAKVFMKWRRSAQSRKHPDNCKRMMESLGRDITRLQGERDQLMRERRGLQLEISIFEEFMKKHNSSEAEYSHMYSD